MANRALIASTLLALMALAPCALARFEPKGAQVTLRAKWQGTPLVHEAAEFLVGTTWRALRDALRILDHMLTW